MADTAEYLRNAQLAAVEGDVHPTLQNVLARTGSKEIRALVDFRSTYLEAHYADRIDPPSGGEWGSRDLFAALRRSGQKRAAIAIELGCSTGRGLHELAQNADLVIGIDSDLSALRRARRILAGKPVRFARRSIGRNYEAATVLPYKTPVRVALICADALHVPLASNVADRVVALNLIDQVSSPSKALASMDRLCKGGGQLIVASPYFWESNDPADSLDVADPAVRLRVTLSAGMFLSGRYRIDEEMEIPWSLRITRRSTNSYEVHFLSATKLGGKTLGKKTTKPKKRSGTKRKR